MIIGISGKARVGKDTFGKMLARELYKLEGNSYVLMSYAHELKLRLQKDFDLTYDQLWGDKKEIPDTRYLKSKGISGQNNVYWTPRELLQFYGTDCFRAIDNNFWVKALFRIIDEKEFTNVIITDIRFRNEVDIVIARGGVHIRILRDNVSEIHGTNHTSETTLSDDYYVTFLIQNFGTLGDLAKTAKSTSEAIFILNKNRG